MVSIALVWSDLKSKDLQLSYAEAYGNFYMYAASATSAYSCVVTTDSTDGQDFDTNYRAQAISLV